MCAAYGLYVIFVKYTCSRHLIKIKKTKLNVGFLES